MIPQRFLCFLVGTGLALPCLGAETIYLSNGFCLEAQAHTVQAGDIIVKTATGTLEFPEKLVERIATDQVVPTAPRPKASPADLLKRAADGEGLEPELVESVAKIESGLQQSAISSKGATGLMQLMPGTAAEVGANAAEADSNALGGAKYLRELLLRYRGNYVLALAAYNAGPGAVAKYKGVPPYTETVRYVEKVLREYEREKGKAISSRLSANAKADRCKLNAENFQ